MDSLGGRPPPPVRAPRAGRRGRAAAHPSPGPGPRPVRPAAGRTRRRRTAERGMGSRRARRSRRLRRGRGRARQPGTVRSRIDAVGRRPEASPSEGGARREAAESPAHAACVPGHRGIGSRDHRLGLPTAGHRAPGGVAGAAARRGTAVVPVVVALGGAEGWRPPSRRAWNPCVIPRWLRRLGFWLWRSYRSVLDPRPDIHSAERIIGNYSKAAVDGTRPAAGSQVTGHEDAQVAPHRLFHELMMPARSAGSCNDACTHVIRVT